MLVTNSFSEDILVFVYDVGDPLFFACLREPSLHLLTFANDEILIPAGQSMRLVHKTATDWQVGIKRGTLTGRFEPFLVPLDGQTYTASARLEVTPGGQLLWLNAPKITNPTQRLPEVDLMQPLPPAPGHVVGVGRANITDAAVLTLESALPMQGWTSTSQTTTGIELLPDNAPVWLQARAFIIGDPASATRCVLVVADIWSCSIAIKQEVVRRLSYGNPESPYRMDNIWIAGTHTHSAPSGYLHHFLYNAAGFGFDAHVFESVVAGIVAAVEAAHSSLAPGRVRLGRGRLQGITRNRSLPAFLNNPAADQAAFPNAVDDVMTLLSFEREDPAGSGTLKSIGALNWFAIHPTNRGEQFRLVSGDNKGHASRIMEEGFGPGFVAGFANACAGDVSGNIDPNGSGFFPVNGTDFTEQAKRMLEAAEAQAKLATDLVATAGPELRGPVQTLEHRLHMPKRTGTVAAVGLSMAAGSTEDGGQKLMPEGITLLSPNDPAQTSAGLMTVGALAAATLAPLNRLLAATTGLLSGQPLAALRGVLTALPVTDAAMLIAHYPKPILLSPGMMQPDPWTPEVLPLQLVRIGQFAALGVPAEVTTVAGLRLRQAMQTDLSALGVEISVVSTYTNGYASYVTTPEEYDTQQYEGASTLFGRDTCTVLANGAAEMARALRSRRGGLRPDAALADLRGRVLAKRRMTVRNLTKARMMVRICMVGETAPLWPGAQYTVDAGEDVAVILPLPWSLVTESVHVMAFPPNTAPAKARRVIATTSDLVIIPPKGTPLRSAYFPTQRKL
ncbi:neutral/alkaline non-lysosomal ceramidase N-terminal domain-containing protein [Tabrizicola sp.]|uniref:neutral/alkaline non-lysosomal ceramidase N-terminal domain-containing protein n=1 Tax=Tabrizicola sp. TaxID=2005166 RepID=UPI0025E30C08|nr:neutral/alkaline non-lysosomal ceramidase N-terminal domain-containing protein [Tabrizicola sp.]